MDNRATLVGAVMGAALGGTIGYLFFTEAGLRRREDLSRRIDHLAENYRELEGLWQRLRVVGERYRTGPTDALIADIANVLRSDRPGSLGGAA